MAASRAFGGLEGHVRAGESQLKGFQQAGVTWGCSGQGEHRGVQRGTSVFVLVRPWGASCDPTPLKQPRFLVCLACELSRGSSGFVLTDLDVSSVLLLLMRCHKDEISLASHCQQWGHQGT